MYTKGREHKEEIILKQVTYSDEVASRLKWPFIRGRKMVPCDTPSVLPQECRLTATHQTTNAI